MEINHLCDIWLNLWICTVIPDREESYKGDGWRGYNAVLYQSLIGENRVVLSVVLGFFVLYQSLIGKNRGVKYHVQFETMDVCINPL